MVKAILFFLFLPIFCFSDDSPTVASMRWRAQVYGGVILETLDGEAQGLGFNSTRYQHDRSSPMFGIDLFHSLYFASDRWQFFYGGGLQRLKSVEKLGGSKIETTITSLVGQTGLIWRPSSTPDWGFGVSGGLFVFSEGESRLKTNSLNRPIRKGSGLFGGDGPTPPVEVHLWLLYQWHPRWDCFMRFDSYLLSRSYSTNLGVSYAF